MSQVSEVKEEVVATLEAKAEEAAEAVKNVVKEAEAVKENVTEKAEAAKEQLSEAVSAVKEEAEQAGEKAAEKVESLKEEVKETMADYQNELEASLKQGPPTDDPVWAHFEELLESKEAIPVKIENVVKGGVIAFVDGIRAFIPASKAALNHVDDLETLKGQETEAVVITAEKAGKKLVLSVRDALRKKAAADKAARMAECVEGAVMEGTVDSVMDYGAFIKLDNGVSGLLHVSQISYERVAKPADVLNKGDRVTVKIIAVKDGKISLSKKALEEAPARKERKPREDRPAREPKEGGERERRPRERREKEEVFNYKETGKATTSLASLLNDIKLD